LIIYTLFYILGIDLWIFPNLTDDKLGVIDSFKPFYSYEKREENLSTILIRIHIAIVFVFSCVYVYNEPQVIFDFTDHVTEIYSDIFHWGNDKIKNYHNGTAISVVGRGDKYRRILDEEDIMYDFN